MPQVGLKDLYYAKMNEADETYQTPKKISGAITADINPTTNSATQYSDDGPSLTATSLGEIATSLQIEDLSDEAYADLMGHTIDTNGAVVKKSTDVAPYVAIGFRSEKANGAYRYVWLYKGKFRVPSQSYQTKNDQPAFQNPTIEATFVRRKKDDLWQIHRDDPDLGATWFDTVYEPNADTTAPTVTITPADGATAVATSSDVVWTFDKAIQSSSVNDANFFVMDSLGNLVDGTLTLDGTAKVVTFAPAAALASAMDYTAIATKNVKSSSGYALAANSVTNFQTA